MAAASLADRLRAQITSAGPISVSTFVAAALYDDAEGFYATGGQAGRRGDFLTAPEVGPLFGAVISRAVDAWWRAAGAPDRFVVAEHGAGPGTLARTVTLANGACLQAGALEWVLVERSAAQRADHPIAPHLRSLSDANTLDRVDVVFANELLDNLPFDVVRFSADRWHELVVNVSDGTFALVDGAPVDAPEAAGTVPPGTLLPVATAARHWVEHQRDCHPGARLVVFDYAASTAELVRRGGAWLRAYRGHEQVDDWLSDPGSCDITIDLPLEPVASTGPAVLRSQADFLRIHGIDDLVEDGRSQWHQGAAVGDLAALRARSRIREAEALLDPAGMGAFTVFEWGPTATLPTP